VSQIQPSTNCERVWYLANRWLDECEAWHPNCKVSNVARTLPTRLLKVGRDNDPIRLVTSDTLPSNTRYTTLSHCWGLKPLETLTRSNFDDFLVDIPFGSLSNTFKHAIHATRQLGLRYLWVFYFSLHSTTGPVCLESGADIFISNRSIACALYRRMQMIGSAKPPK
jgi:hypothetical protein